MFFVVGSREFKRAALKQRVAAFAAIAPVRQPGGGHAIEGRARRARNNEIVGLRHDSSSFPRHRAVF